MPNKFSKRQVLAQVGRSDVRRDIGRSEMVEGQESLHTAAGPTGYICSAIVFMSHSRKNKTVLIFQFFTYDSSQYVP
jgi:hypothetical protein